MKSGDSARRSGVKAKAPSYLVATAIVVIALALKVTLSAYLEPPYILFYPSVLVAAVVGGLGPGIWATLLAGLLAWYWVLEPSRSFELRHFADVAGLAVFVGAGVFVSLIAERYRRSQAALAALERDRAVAEAEAASRQREEQALRKSEDAAKRHANELQAVFAAAPAAILITHDRGIRHVSMNSFGAGVLGVKTDANISQTPPAGERALPLKFMKAGAELPVESLPMRIAASQGVPVRDFEFDVVQTNGVLKHLIGNASPLRDESGELAGAVGVFLDVTRQKQADERLRALTENALDMILVLGPDGRVEFRSPNMAELLGRPDDEVLGKSFLDFAHSDDRARLADDFKAALESPGITVRNTSRFVRKDGTVRVLEAVGRNLLEVPAVRGVVVNARDVTEQRQTEALFQHAQKLESVGRLAGGVAHDFNNLLTVILAGAHEIRTDLESGSRIDSELVEDIVAAGERARALTSQLLTFARKQPVASATVDINEVVGKCESALRRMLGEDVELQVALQPDLWTTFCDPGQVEQVVLNLAVNARDAMPNGGRLTIETRNAVVSNSDTSRGPEAEPGEWVQLLVRDFGSGMSPEVKAHLFEPFFTTKPRGKGTGLGLATVHGIVHQVGGHIHVKSDPEMGTTFQICFPRKEAAAAATVEKAEPVPPGGTETILVVEDEPSVRAMAVRTLRQKGYRVLVAASGQEVRDLADEQVAQLHLLLTDVVMPGASGREVAEELRRRRPGMSVLYMSGYAAEAFAGGSALEARSAFLPKPFTGPTLLRRVREVLDRA